MKHKILIVSSSPDTGGAQKMISNITTNLPKGWEAGYSAEFLIKTSSFPIKAKFFHWIFGAFQQNEHSVSGQGIAEKG